MVMVEYFLTGKKELFVLSDANMPHNYYASDRLPLSAFLLFKIGDEIFDLGDKRYLLSFKMEKTPDAVNSFTVVAHNVTDYNLEVKALKALNEMEVVSFQYGHSEGLRSPWMLGHIINFTPTFTSDMTMTVAMTGNTGYNIDAGEKRHYKAWSYSDLVRQVIRDSEWNEGIVVDTARFSEEREFEWTGQSVPRFIHSATMGAVSNEGVKMIAYFINTTEEPYSAYFIPMDFNLFHLNKTYIISPSVHSPVLDFTPGYSGTSIKHFPIDSGYILDDANEIGRSHGGDPNLIGATGRVVRSHLNRDSVKQLVASQWFHSNIAAYTGSMQLIGDPDLLPTQIINIIPVSKDGSVHHTAGPYLINKVEDDISGGSYKTLLEVVHYLGASPDFDHEEGID